MTIIVKSSKKPTAIISHFFRAQRTLVSHAQSPKRQMSLSSFLVSPRELQAALEQKPKPERPIIPLSAAWFLPNDPEKRTGTVSFAKQHIPGSRFFDLDKISDTSSPYPHMLPESTVFEYEMGKLGIRREDTVVIYDTAELGIFSAPRVAWTLKVFGHPKVHLLNNFKMWVDEGRPTESATPNIDVQSEEYHIPQPRDIGKHAARFQEIKDNVQNQKALEKSPILVDARPAARWHGISPEPRPGLPSGHIPFSINLPFSDVLDPTTKAILPTDHLFNIFNEKSIPKDREIINSCGTGVTAAVIDVAMQQAGWGVARKIYDGSWTEWASRVVPEDHLIESSNNEK